MKFNFNNSTKITFKGRKFEGVKELGFSEKGNFLVSLYPCSYIDDKTLRGGYSTTITISSLSYRKNNKDYSAPIGFKINSKFSITIFDEFDTPITIKTDPTIISKLAEECRINELPERKK